MDRQLYLAEIDRVNREGKYHPDWDSLAKHPVPAWYKEKRLGIFLHWGVFSVPSGEGCSGTVSSCVGGASGVTVVTAVGFVLL